MDKTATQKITRKDTASDLDELVGEVYGHIGNPVSVWAVAATLESMGLRDVDVQNDYGYRDVFELGDDVYKRLKKRARKESGSAHAGKSHKISGIDPGKRAAYFFRFYGVGFLFSLPMLSQIAAILIFRFSLWAWLDFNEAQATIVAGGTILAFIVTGGFIQMMGKRVTQHVAAKNYLLAGRASWNIVRYGVLTVLMSALGLYLFNLLLPFYPQKMAVLGLSYFIFISLFLLSAAVLYAIEHRLMIITAILVGTAFVIIAMNQTSLGIYLAQWMGIAITVALMSVYGWLFYRLRISGMDAKLLLQPMARPEVTFYSNYRYFMYGLVYFVFLFLDRMLAWSTGHPPPTYLIWFKTPYELGMDWALISLVLTIAALEYSVQLFSRQLIPTQKQGTFGQIRDFNRFFMDFYKRQLAVVSVVGIMAVIITYFGVLELRTFSDQVPEIADFFASIVTYRVFWLASLGYLLLTIGLLHSLFFFTLNRPAYVLYALSASLLVNFLVGYLCSRIFSYEMAVLGLVAGSLSFALITGWMARRFFHRLDYFYFSAF